MTTNGAGGVGNSSLTSGKLTLVADGRPHTVPLELQQNAAGAVQMRIRRAMLHSELIVGRTYPAARKGDPTLKLARVVEGTPDYWLLENATADDETKNA